MNSKVVHAPLNPAYNSGKPVTVSSDFAPRHIGPSIEQQIEMLSSIGCTTIDNLIQQTIPKAIRLNRSLNLDSGLSEQDALTELRHIAKQNTVNKSYIGMGYYDTYTPNVILRNVLENPAWYTAYTPYQPEISQGRLESLLNFQQMVMDLTGMPIANASLLDEATAAAEAMALCARSSKSKSKQFFVADDTHPQTIGVIKTRAEYFGFDIIIASANELNEHDVFGALLQYPGTFGDITNIEPIIVKAKENNICVAVASDLLALLLLKSPGEMGADIVLGSSQRFGVPMGYGGPHAAFFATNDKMKRSLPGRIIGVSIDARGNQAYRMAMQTREQHIRREKATSNICTAQALLANMAAFYAVYHGPQGLRDIASRVHSLTKSLASALNAQGISTNTSFFDTLTFAGSDAIYKNAHEAGVNLRNIDANTLGVSFDETTTHEDVEQLLNIITGKQLVLSSELPLHDESLGIPAALIRTSNYLEHPNFNSYHSETEMLRYLKSLENKDYSLVHGMIPLGSCTMKLNATAEMIPISWPEFARMHPFAPIEQATGYLQLLDELRRQLIEITGYEEVSLQPNSGASGEYAGLLAIKRYHESLDQGHRNVCLIPSSAHGTNPATAAMMGMEIVVVECDSNGNVDVDDLQAKAEMYADCLSSLMITYPSTHGIFEEKIISICDIVHANGGQIYLDGANLNAQVGLCRPGDFGADVSHLNLHKTFAIPHGGGGPGVGPIGVKSHLAPFLPGHNEIQVEGLVNNNGAVAAAPFGSAGILPITWMYNKMLGREGLKQATETAILNANYITEQLAEHYPVLYRGHANRIAHECIIDLRPIKHATGISEEDIAKRLMDYGFHAPTMSFPVAGTLMIEPTESESQTELDRFIEAMIGIREEIRKVERGEWQAEESPLRHAPHTQEDLVSADWDRPYSREQAVFPTAAIRKNKYWPTVNRVDNVYGDRNLVCSCPAVDNYL
jgi:glycine dehydrogenase